MIEVALTYSFLFISLFFEVFLLVSFLERRTTRAAVRSLTQAELPTVAIAVPSYNEATSVGETIKSLLALDYPREKLAIIAIDDGSTDNTLAVLRSFEADGVRVLGKENGGKHSAMNLALQNTDAQFIGCLDADSVVAPDALLRIVPVFQNERVAAVTPGIHVKKPGNFLQQLQHVEYRLSIFNRFIMAAIGSAFITPGPFSIFRTRVIRELGGWRYAHSTEDMEMALRIQEAGHWIANAPKAIVHTAIPATFSRLFRQRVRWTYGWLRNAFDYRHMLGNNKYGNLSLIVFPAAILTIFTGIYFFFRILYYAAIGMYGKYMQIHYAGISSPSFELFYVNTSAMYILIIVAVVIVLTLISLGSRIGTGSRLPPISTPLFFIFYSFIAPLWLSAAVVRALLRTGVQWR